MNKIFRSKHGMLAVVNPETGVGFWLETLSPIYGRIDVTDGWTEMEVREPVNEVDEPDAPTVGSRRRRDGDVVIEVLLASNNDPQTVLDQFQRHEAVRPGDFVVGQYVIKDLAARPA